MLIHVASTNGLVTSLGIIIHMYNYYTLFNLLSVIEMYVFMFLCTGFDLE